MNAVPRRPALRYMGGKWLLAPKIIPYFPAHRRYVEPFGGAASVLLQKPRAYAEIYNDLNAEVVNLFAVLRDDTLAARLVSHLERTPFARAEFLASYDVTSRDPVERARRLVVRSFQGFGSAGVNAATTGFRSNSDRSGTTPAHDWTNLPSSLAQVAARFKSVVIEQLDACDVLRRFDREDTLAYVDPPYMPDTRSKKKGPQGMYHSYRHDMGEDDHVRLLTTLLGLKSMVVLSGYHSMLYDAALHEWQRVELDAFAAGARPRVEVLWINPPAAAALAAERRAVATAERARRSPLFAAAE